MTSHLLCMMSHSLCVLHDTMSLSMTSNIICLWHIHFIWHPAQCYDHTTIMCLHSNYAWHYIQCIFDIRHNVPIFWKEVNVCHHRLYIYDTICTTYDIKSTHYVGHHRHYLWLTSSFDYIIPLFIYHGTHYVCDILSTIYYVTHTVWQHKLYIWLETHSICHHMSCICHHTHTVEDITPTM